MVEVLEILNAAKGGDLADPVLRALRALTGRNPVEVVKQGNEALPGEGNLVALVGRLERSR